MVTKTVIGISSCVSLKVFNTKTLGTVQRQMYEAILAKYPEADNFHWESDFSFGHADFDNGLQHYEYYLGADPCSGSYGD